MNTNDFTVEETKSASNVTITEQYKQFLLGTINLEKKTISKFTTSMVRDVVITQSGKRISQPRAWKLINRDFNIVKSVKLSNKNFYVLDTNNSVTKALVSELVASTNKQK